MMGNYFAIIPAAGVGERFGGGTKKQFLVLCGKSLLEWTLNTFLGTEIFKKIIICLSKEELKRIDSLPKSKELCYVEGGKSRAESVYKGFCQLDTSDNDFVLIHDAVRPLVSSELIKRVVETTEKKGSAIPMLLVSDTIKETKGDQIVCTVDRKKLVTVQTPQGFKASILKHAYDNVKTDQWGWTDEAMLVEKLGEKIFGVEGEKGNIKITTAEDLRLAEFLVGSRRS